MKRKQLIETFTKIRSYFPSLSDEYNGEKVVFLDNSAGSQVPLPVIDRVNQFYIHRNAQKGSIFTRTEKMQETIIQGRQLAAELIGAADHTEIAFGLNATSFFQLLAHHLARDLKAGDSIIITEADHRANVDPWVELEERGIHVHLWQVDNEGNLDYDQYAELLKLSPKIVAAGWISNATGTIHDMKRLTEMAHAVGALVIADGVQQASHCPTNVKEAGVDFAAFSTYKIFGPHMGFCYFNRENMDRLNGYKIKEMLTDDSFVFEVGTQNHEGIEAFIGSMEYLIILSDELAKSEFFIDMPNLNGNDNRQKLFNAMYFAKEYEKELSYHFLSKLQQFSDVELYGKGLESIDERVPVFSFNFKGINTEELAIQLKDHGIEARTGNYYAINIMNKLAHNFGGSALRISLVHYNSFAEIDYLFDCLQTVVTAKENRGTCVE